LLKRRDGHAVYILRGERFTLHRGSKPDPEEFRNVRRRLRHIGVLR